MFVSTLESSLYVGRGLHSHVVVVKSAVRQAGVSSSGVQELIGLITGSGSLANRMKERATDNRDLLQEVHVNSGNLAHGKSKKGGGGKEKGRMKKGRDSWLG